MHCSPLLCDVYVQIAKEKGSRRTTTRKKEQQQQHSVFIFVVEIAAQA
jgi:hypothetical protein